MKVYNSYWKQSGNCLILSLMFFSPQIWWLQCNSPHSHAHIFLANRNLSVSTEETQTTTTYVKFKPTAKALGMWLNASVLLLWMLSQLLLYLRIEVNLFVIQTKYLCPEYYFKLWQLQWEQSQQTCFEVATLYATPLCFLQPPSQSE